MIMHMIIEQSMKTERITILAPAKFKRQLESEATQAKISVAELVRRRFTTGQDPDEQLLIDLTAALREQTAQTRQAVQAACKTVEATIAELRKQRCSASNAGGSDA